jgi:hypothetical protein
MSNPVLKFLFMDKPPVEYTLEQVFHFRDELEIMRNMLQCPQYHGNTFNVLYGCHGFNLCARLKPLFHAQLEFRERVAILQQVLPALDHDDPNAPPVSETARDMIAQYRVWRQEELPTLFYCARALHDAVFRSRNRCHIMSESDYDYDDENTSTRLRRIKAYLCAVNTRYTTRGDVCQTISAHAKHLRLDCSVHATQLVQLEEIDKTLRNYKWANEFIETDDYRIANAIPTSTLMKTLFPVHFQEQAWVRRFIRQLFKCYITSKRCVIVSPKVAQTDMLVRTNTEFF